MKTNVLFLLTVLLASAFNIQAQRGIRVAYIDMEYILENVNEYQQANTQLGAKVQKWKGEIEQRRSAIEQMKKDLSVEKVLLTKELAQEREEEIAILEKELLDYQQDRFGPQGDLVVQRSLLAKPVQDQVFSAVQEIAKNKRYDMVFDRSDAVMLYALEKHDISDLVLRSLNRSEKRAEREAKSKKGKQRFSEDDDTVTIEPEESVNPELEARKQAAQEEREERQRELEELKQKKLEEREAKKKAYEERRKKLLAEREARKKAKEEERKKAKEDNDQEDPDAENNN